MKRCEEVFNLGQEEFSSERGADKRSSDISEDGRGEYKTESDASDLAEHCPFCKLYTDTECPYCSAERHAKVKSKQDFSNSSRLHSSEATQPFLTTGYFIMGQMMPYNK